MTQTEHAKDSKKNRCGTQFRQCVCGYRAAKSRGEEEKARLAFAINEVIRNRELSLAATARSLNVDRADVSALLKYRLKTFSVAGLKEFLAKLGREWCSVDSLRQRVP